MLSGRDLKKLRPKAGKKEELIFDNNIRGLALRVRASGNSTWVVQYRPKFIIGDRSRIPTKKYIVGKLDLMGLSEARREARALLAKIDTGSDPLAEKQARLRQEQRLLKNMLGLYDADLMRRSVVNRKTYLSTLYRNLNGLLLREVESVTLQSLLEIQEAMIKKGKYGAASDFRKCSSAFFSFCIQKDIIKNNPWSSYRQQRKTRAEIIKAKEYGRTLNDQELILVSRAANNMGGSFGYIIQFLMLSGCRRTEASHLQRDWIREDGWIAFPEYFTKQGRDHLLPITTQLKSLIDQSPNRGKIIWPSNKSQTESEPTIISGWSKLVPRLRREAEITDFNLHDLRRTFRTWAEERYGATETLAEAAIGHVSKNVLTRIYSRPMWENELRSLYEAWHNHLNKIGALNYG